MCIEKCEPKRPVPVMHFHGTKDRTVPFAGPNKIILRFMSFKSVDDSVKTWAKVNGCVEKPTSVKLPNKIDDGTSVTKRTFGGGKDGAEVILFAIEGGGHTWPGKEPPLQFLGKSTKNISANDLMWEFFQKHPMK